MSDGNGESRLNGLQAWRVLTARTGWCVSPRRFYELLKARRIPCHVLHGAHNSRYTIQREELERWAAGKESGWPGLGAPRTVPTPDD